MARPGPEAPAQRWPVRGFWRTWFWCSAMLGLAFLACGVGVIVLGGLTGGPALLLPGMVVFAVGTVISWQVLHTATEVALRSDGTLVLRRLSGPLHTRVARVTRARRSAVRSSYTPTVLETADGWVYLIHDRRDKDDIIAAIQARNPGLGAEV